MKVFLFIFWIWIVIFDQKIANAQIEKRHIILDDAKSYVLISETFSEIEREYESGVRIIDETYSSAFISAIDFHSTNFLKGYQFGMGLNYISDAKNVNKFDTNLSLSNTRYKEASFIGNPFLEVMKRFDSSITGYEHFLKLKYTIPVGKKQHLFLEERNILQFSYLFQSQTEVNWKIQTEIFARYFGKIETHKKFVGFEKRESFSEIGFNFQPAYELKKFKIIPLLGFSFMTDYNTHNDSYSRITDKGFSYSGGIDLQYSIHQFLLSLVYFSSSYVFNAISDDPNRDIDNEFEKRTIKLAVGVLF